jgi:hypothetical protein
MLHIHIRCKHKCFKCFSYFIRMLQVFYLDVTYVCNDFQAFFRCFCKCFRRVSSAFFCMLQLLYLDISKVDRVLHMRCAWEVAGGVGDVRGGTGPLLGRSLASPKCWGARLHAERGTVI